MIPALMFLALVGLILLNVPIAIALGLTAMGAIVMFNGATSFPLLAIPLFILAGAIMNSSGLSRRLIAFASALFGFVKGGLAMSTSAPRCSSPRSRARRWPTSPRSARS
jgi:C4-dicarboxylate transporter, DctM subunit